MITYIRDVLEKQMRWKVRKTPADSLGNGEILVKMDDLHIEQISTDEYHARVYVLLQWDEANPDDVPTKVVRLVKDLEEKLLRTTAPGKGTFRFDHVDYDPLGTTDRVSVVVMYKEVINIG